MQTQQIPSRRPHRRSSTQRRTQAPLIQSTASTQLALTLLMARIQRANHVVPALPANHFAAFANPLHTRTNLHVRLHFPSTTPHPPQHPTSGTTRIRPVDLLATEPFHRLESQPPPPLLSGRLRRESTMLATTTPLLQVFRLNFFRFRPFRPYRSSTFNRSAASAPPVPPR